MIQTKWPSYARVVEMMASAEQADGWLGVCQAKNRFVSLTSEFVDALVQQLQSLEAGLILEVCAGGGELAVALDAHGVKVIATDIDPPNNSVVSRLDAVEALRRFRPATVLASFVPFDADVDRAVFAESSVEHYLVLNARLNGQFGNNVLWNSPLWSVAPLPKISRWMICRHDVWMGPDHPILQHGEAWLFKRVKT